MLEISKIAFSLFLVIGVGWTLYDHWCELRDRLPPEARRPYTPKRPEE